MLAANGVVEVRLSEMSYNFHGILHKPCAQALIPNRSAGRIGLFSKGDGFE